MDHMCWVTGHNPKFHEVLHRCSRLVGQEALDRTETFDFAKDSETSAAETAYFCKENAQEERQTAEAGEGVQQ